MEPRLPRRVHPQSSPRTKQLHIPRLLPPTPTLDLRGLEPGMDGQIQHPGLEHHKLYAYVSTHSSTLNLAQTHTVRCLQTRPPLLPRHPPLPALDPGLGNRLPSIPVVFRRFCHVPAGSCLHLPAPFRLRRVDSDGLRISTP